MNPTGWVSSTHHLKTDKYPVSEKFYFVVTDNPGLLTKSINPVILGVTHNRLNPLEST
jgi:hypothetical protein